MVLVNELLDQSGAKIEQILNILEQDQFELKHEQIITHAQEIRKTFQEMCVSLQPVHYLFHGFDLESIPKLCISSQDFLQFLLQNSQKQEEKEEAVSSSNCLELSTTEHAIIQENNAEQAIIEVNGAKLFAKQAISKEEYQNNAKLSMEQVTREEEDETKNNTAKACNYKYQGILLPSQVEHMETVWEWLNDQSVGTISIRGSFGVGKTWMARQLMERAVTANIFQVVIWLDRSDKDVDECQEQIVHQLQLSATRVPNGQYYKKEDLMEKVALSLRKKKFLVIIDGIDSSDDLSDFGFSHPQQQNKSSKVLVTGSLMSEMVFTRLVTDKVREVECLSKLEAWSLFLGITGLDIDSPNVREVVRPLLESSQGVPSEIVSYGGIAADFTKRICDLVNLGRKDVIDCLQFCTYFHHSVRFEEESLIPSWIVEIFPDEFDHLDLENAYEKGHNILKEIGNSEFLLYSNYHVLRHLRLESFSNRTVFNRDHVYRFYLTIRAALMNENFQFMISEYLREYSSSQTKFLVLHGKQGLPQEIPDLFFDKMKQLQSLAILHAGIVSLPESLSNLQELHMLILVGCRSLKDVIQIKSLSSLNILSLSGATSLKEIPDDIFQNVYYIRHLNLSNTQIKRLPLSFSYLCHILQILVLRGCSQLESLPSMEHFLKLTVLDLSGAIALKSIPDTIYKLETLDLSGTLVDKLPSPSNLKFLVELFLRGCSQIKTMPHPGAFHKLRVLDLSGATAFREFQSETSQSDYCLIKLDLSGSLVVQVPPLLAFVELRELLLRNCCNLETIPTLGSELEELDLSGSIAFKNFQDESLCVQLRNLDVSRTQIKKIPMLPMHSVMVQLILKDCEFLEELPPLELPRLQVLDLSGSTKFKTFKNDSFEKLCRLRTLNLSKTQVATLPTLSGCSDLRQIILRNCMMLEILPQVCTLMKLALLDLSGAIAFKQFQDNSLGKMEDLQELNLFGTQVVQIPSISECHNLRNLILGNCSKLEILPNLEALSALVVLDLSRAGSLKKFPDQSIGQKNYHLQVLDLSGTQVSDLSFLSGCINICQLFLRDCPNIQTLPPLDELTSLEMFDLSGTNIGEFSFLSGCKNLRQLLLRGCSNLEMLSFEGMHNLQKVDLSERPIKRLPPSISGLKNVRTLLLKECSSLEALPQIELLTGLEVLDLSCTKIRKLTNDISALTHLRFLKLEEGTNNLWEFHNGKSLEKFHFCLFAPKERIGERDVYLQEEQYSFRDIYYQTSHIPQLTDEADRFFKICGFETFPGGIEEVLIHVQLLYLKKNKFITRLSDLGAESIKEMRECWIENCDSMESAIYGEEVEENEALGSCLQNLWVSKLSELKSLFRGVVQSGSFTMLKHLYIECCPSLITVFSSHLELKNLEVLKIKFCDKLESIFGEMVLGENTLPKLMTLILLKLPKLHSICGRVLPSLKNLRVIGCSKIKRLPVSRNTTSPRVKITGEAIWWNDLEWEDETTKSHLRFSPF